MIKNSLQKSSLNPACLNHKLLAQFIETKNPEAPKNKAWYSS